MRNYYEILGVDKSATTEEIRSRYIFLVKVYHPDRFTDPDSKTRAENDLKEINLAYGILSNPKKRQEYDSKINLRENVHSEWANNQTEDDDPQEKFDLVIAYVKEVEKRWNHILEPLPDITSTERSFDNLTNLAVTLVYKILPEKSSSDKKIVIDEISHKTFAIISLNIMLGAEYEKFGYNSQISPGLVQLWTSSYVITQLFDLLTKGQLENRITESEFNQYFEWITNIISAICQTSEIIGRDLVQKQNQADQSAKNTSNNQNSRKSEVHSSGKKEPDVKVSGYCQSCLAKVPTENVTFKQNIGAIFVRFTKKIEGELCAECIEKNFWEMTGKTLLFGWFGVISFITTPFILIGNLVDYFSTKRLRNNSSNLSSIAVGWKFLIFLILTVTIFIGFLLGSSNTSKATTQQLPTQAQAKITAAPTRTPSPTKRPTQVRVIYKSPTPDNRCILWSKVTASDKGKKLCVYGTVKKAYWGEDIFYMTFGDDLYDFRMLVLNGYYYKDIQGKCVSVEGVVKTYQDLPYIEVTNNLMTCP